MATVQPTITDIAGDHSVELVSWDLTTANHTGAAIDRVQWADRTVTFVGTNWGGATAILEGSNDAATFIGLTDPQGTAISKTGDAVEAVLELTNWMRPRLSVAGTAAVVNVSMVVRRPTPIRM